MYSVWATPKGGLPHSDIRGSKGARPSPRLFAACHVLHRLLVPRHPLNALLSLSSRPPCAEPSMPVVSGQWSVVRKARQPPPHTKPLIRGRTSQPHHTSSRSPQAQRSRKRGQTHARTIPGGCFQNLFTLTMTTSSAELPARPLARCRAKRPTKPKHPRNKWSVVSDQWSDKMSDPPPRQTTQPRHAASALLVPHAAGATRHATSALLVEVDGIEPTTPCLQSRCSPS
jgi:hypothetical protein